MQAAGTSEAHDAGGPVDNPPTWRFYLGALIVTGLVLVSYVVGVLLPYVVNDLHRLPLAEVASGAHDPKDMWPQGHSALPAVIQIVGLLAVTLGPMVALGVFLVVAWTLWHGRGRTARSARLLGLATASLSLLLAATLWSPWGLALATWRLD